MVWVPTLNVVVENVATPLVMEAALLMTVAPSRKFTVPVGVAPALPVTVAVSVTLLPPTMVGDEVLSAVALKIPAPVPVRPIV